MANKVVAEYNICVAFATITPSCQIEWELLVLVISDQYQRFFRLPVFHESVDG